MSTLAVGEELSIVLPARDEAEGLAVLLPVLTRRFPRAQIIVVDDGSQDATAEVCGRYPVQLVRHPYPKGNGAAVKTGARLATGRVLLYMDADGQHDPADAERLLQTFESGYDMVVGARGGDSHSSPARRAGNAFFNCLSSWMVGQRIADLTSGFRAVDAEKFRRFLYLLPNGFSYPTTITMAFFRAGFSVGYVPVLARAAAGESHVQLIADGIKFMMIIFRIGSLYSPLKLFGPVSLAFLVLGIGYYLFTFIAYHRFTNMGVLLVSMAVLVFLIGIVSEQVSALYYRGRDEE